MAQLWRWAEVPFHGQGTDFRVPQLAENYAHLEIDPTKGFIIAGEGNGADISLAIAHMYADEASSPPLTGLYLACPQAVTQETVPERYRDYFLSLDQNANAPILTAESLEFIRCKFPPAVSSGDLRVVCVLKRPAQPSTSQTRRALWHTPSPSQTTPRCRGPISRFAAWTPLETVV